MSIKQERFTQVINDWKLNKKLLAEKTGINPYTFKMKLLGTAPQYKFTPEEQERIAAVLRDLAKDIIKITDNR